MIHKIIDGKVYFESESMLEWLDVWFNGMDNVRLIKEQLIKESELVRKIK